MIAVGLAALGPGAGFAPAQTRVRLQNQPSTLQPGATIRGAATTNLQPQPPLPATGSGTVPAPATNSYGLGAPTFDPYAGNAAASPPTLFGGATGVPGGAPAGAPTAVPTSPGYGAPLTPYNSSAATPTWPAWTNPNGTAPPAVYPNSGLGSTPYPGATYPNTGYPGTYSSQPSVLFPNGMFPDWNPNFGWAQPQEGRYLRLFQDIRLKHTWLMGGEGPRAMGTNDTEVGTTLNFPNFFWSGQPLQVSPVFIMHWWDGPETDVTPPDTFPTELPARVYSAYLDFGWQPQITPQLAADLDVSIGVFNDFEGFTADSIRIQGTGLGVLSLTQTLTLKLGVTYLDRVDYKLLPAGGILWTPNPQTRWDIYFPRPKLARYLTTVGNTDVWFYLNGEIGGGSWTVRRAGVDDRRVDMNDIRVGGGFEWTHQYGVQSFIEAAYVFDRELVFASGTLDRHHLKDTVMVRGGFAY